MSFFRRQLPAWERIASFAATAGMVATWVEGAGMKILQEFAVPIYVFLTALFAGFFGQFRNGLMP